MIRHAKVSAKGTLRYKSTQLQTLVNEIDGMPTTALDAQSPNE